MEKVLTPHQRLVLKAVSNVKQLSHFYLSGGTALAAFYFHHRLSDDLDFFTDQKIDPIFLAAFAQKLKKKLHAKKIRFERLYDRYQYFFSLSDHNLKVEFTYYPFQRLAPLHFVDGFRIDHLKDVSANKLMALLNRFDPKDFVDLYFILQKKSLHSLVKDAEKKFGMKIDPIFLGSELSKVRRIQALPKMLKALSFKELTTFFMDRAYILKPQIFN